MSTSECLPDPVHWLLFDETSGKRTLDQITGLYVDVDRYVPVQGHRRGAVRFGKPAPIAKLPPLLDLPAPWSFALWIRRDADSEASTLLSSKCFGLKLEQWGSRSMLGITHYGVRDWQSSASLPLGLWSHLVVVGNAEETQFYINGGLAGSIASSMPLPRTWLGSSGGWTEFLQASIEDLRIYDRPLTANQVGALHAQDSEQAAALAVRFASGEELPAAGALALGTVAAGSTAKVELILSNRGTTPLFVTSALDDRSRQFALKLPPSRTIAPGAEAPITVAFRPKQDGPAQSLLTIESNDPGQRKIELALSVVGDVPAQLPAIKLLVAKTPIAPAERRWLGRVPVGSRKTFPVSICNTGTAVLRIQLAAASPDSCFSFWQGQGPFDVAPGGEFCADLAFSPLTQSSAQAEVTVTSNDPENPSYSFFVYGSGEPARPALLISAVSSDETPDTLGEQPLVLGRAPIGQTIKQLIGLRNNGSGMVTLHEPPKLLETSDASFQIEQPASLQIPLGALLTVPITFCPSTGGPKTGRLRVAWDGGISELNLVALAEL